MWQKRNAASRTPLTINKQMQFKIPKNERVWVHILDGRSEYVITSRWPLRDLFYIYEILEDGKLKKLGSHKNPHILEMQFVEWEE